MTAEVKNSNPARGQWFYRKGIYYILAGLLAIAAVIGWITIEQVENGLALFERIAPSLGAIALFVAGNKTTEGSDEKVTHRDVEDAAAKASATAINSKVFEYMDQVREQVEKLQDRLDGTGGSTPATAAPESGAGTYPRGE